MKNYFIALIPEKRITDEIKQFRLRTIKDELVDALPPHITFKRRFTLNDGFLENDLVNVLTDKSFSKFTVSVESIKKMGDAIALECNSEALKIAHISLIDNLAGKITTKNPEWEQKNFKPHLTIIRSNDLIAMPFDLKTILLTEMILYEIDPTTNRSYAHEVFRISLD